MRHSRVAAAYQRPAAIGYTRIMRSVADDLRDDTRRRMAELTPEARLSLALELGDADAQAFATARALSLRDARNQLARARRAGRVPSCANGD